MRREVGNVGLFQDSEFKEI